MESVGILAKGITRPAIPGTGYVDWVAVAEGLKERKAVAVPIISLETVVEGLTELAEEIEWIASDKGIFIGDLEVSYPLFMLDVLKVLGIPDDEMVNILGEKLYGYILQVLDPGK